MRNYRSFPLSGLKVDRQPLGPRTLAIADHLRSGGSVPPIHVERKQDGWHIKDGRHRYVAHKLIGATHINVKYGVLQ